MSRLLDKSIKAQHIVKKQRRLPGGVVEFLKNRRYPLVMKDLSEKNLNHFNDTATYDDLRRKPTKELFFCLTPLNVQHNQAWKSSDFIRTTRNLVYQANIQTTERFVTVKTLPIINCSSKFATTVPKYFSRLSHLIYLPKPRPPRQNTPSQRYPFHDSQLPLDVLLEEPLGQTQRSVYKPRRYRHNSGSQTIFSLKRRLPR